MANEPNDGSTATLTSETPTSEVMKAASERTDAEAFGREESSTPKENASEPTGEVEKTQATEGKTEEAKTEEASEDEGVISEGEPIPYDRFKKVISQRNTIKDELAKLRTESEQMQSVLNDPDVLRVALSKQGWKDEKINQLLTERGMKPAEEKKPDDVQLQLKELSKDLDLSTTDGWAMYQYRIAQLAAENKAKEKITEYDKTQESKAKTKEFVASQEKVAKELAEKTYKIPYGEAGKDDIKRNLSTALGKISAYLDKNPDDAFLGHAKLLKLAMSEEAFKKGEDKGVVKEQERQKQLKSAALEGDEATKGEDAPRSDWPVQRILSWRRAHPNG